MNQNDDGFDIRMEDLPEDLQAIAGLIGMDAVLLLCAQFGGERVYFTKLESIMAAARDRDIVAAFDGRNHMALARKYNLTSTRIRQILADAEAATRRDRQKHQQLPLQF